MEPSKTLDRDGAFAKKAASAAVALGFSFALAAAALAPSSASAAQSSLSDAPAGYAAVGASGLGGVDAARSAVARLASEVSDPALLAAGASAVAMFNWKGLVPKSSSVDAFGGIRACVWHAPVVPIHWLVPAFKAAGFADPAAAALEFVSLHEQAHCRPGAPRPSLSASAEKLAEQTLLEEAAADRQAAAELLRKMPEGDPVRTGRALFAGRLANWLASSPLHAPSKALLSLPDASVAAEPISLVPEAAALREAYAKGSEPPAGADAALGAPEGTAAAAFAAGRAGPPKGDAWVDEWFEARRAAKRAEAGRRAALEKAAATDPEAAFRLGAEMVVADALQSLKAGNEAEALAALGRGRELMRSAGSPARARAVETAYHIAAGGLAKGGAATGADPEMRSAFIRTWCSERPAGGGPVRSLEGLAAQRLGALPGDCRPETASGQGSGTEPAPRTASGS